HLGGHLGAESFNLFFNDYAETFLAILRNSTVGRVRGRTRSVAGSSVTALDLHIIIGHKTLKNRFRLLVHGDRFFRFCSADFSCLPESERLERMTENREPTTLFTPGE